ncbi:MAG TPA: hypothetical protein PK264_18610 [Hyphomicrobiaceae bacterium]|nr:hypothetical protein [Hyphomicrobiaceae bacterium]
MASRGAIVHLIGPAGVGKLTVARALAPMLDAIVVDNHWINNPVLGLLRHDRVTPYPAQVWTEIEKVREAVLATIAVICPPEQSYILTNELYDGEDDRALGQQVARAAEMRGSPYLPVRLHCAPEALASRVVSPDRAPRLKSMDADTARRNASRGALMTGSASELTLDTTDLEPHATALRIAAHVQRVRQAC